MCDFVQATVRRRDDHVTEWDVANVPIETDGLRADGSAQVHGNGEDALNPRDSVGCSMMAHIQSYAR